VKAERKPKRKFLEPFWPEPGPRAEQAYFQCCDLLQVLDRHAAEGACDLATVLLEAAAAYLEDLINQPEFYPSRWPSMVMPPRIPAPVYNHRLIRRLTTAQTSGRDGLKIPTPTVQELETLFNLPSEPGSASQEGHSPSL
jgi:hypothetical protein